MKNCRRPPLQRTACDLLSVDCVLLTDAALAGRLADTGALLLLPAVRRLGSLRPKEGDLLRLPSEWPLSLDPNVIWNEMLSAVGIV